jgi:hypothetical protein
MTSATIYIARRAVCVIASRYATVKLSQRVDELVPKLRFWKLLLYPAELRDRKENFRSRYFLGTDFRSLNIPSYSSANCTAGRRSGPSTKRTLRKGSILNQVVVAHRGPVAVVGTGVGVLDLL